MLDSTKKQKSSLLARTYSRFRAYHPTAIADFQVYPAPERADSVLFFAPHPDDEALAAGGYLHQAVKAGAKCLVVLVTDGDRRGLKEIRAKEFSAVLHALGVQHENSVRLEYVNGDLHKVSKEELQGEFSKIISSFGPTVVIAPHLADLHREHKVISMLVEEIYDKDPSFDLLQYLIHYPPHYPWPRKFSPTAPLLPPVNLSMTKAEWVVVPLTIAEVEHKRNVVELYSSQLKTPILRSLMYSLVRSNELFKFLPKK